MFETTLPAALEYYYNWQNWTNWGFILQALTVLLIGYGIIIALPKRITEIITSQDILGYLMIIFGVALAGSNLVIPAVIAIVQTMTANKVMLTLVGIGLIVFAVIFFSNRRENDNKTRG